MKLRIKSCEILGTYVARPVRPRHAKLCQDLRMARNKKTRVGLIADTHGLLRPEARAFLLAAEHIVHAGDIGERTILDELHSIAHTTAVRGKRACRRAFSSFGESIWSLGRSDTYINW